MNYVMLKYIKYIPILTHRCKLEEVLNLDKFENVMNLQKAYTQEPIIKEGFLFKITEMSRWSLKSLPIQ